MSVAAPRELAHFLLLSHADQVDAIRRLARQGMSDLTIAAATRLAVEQVRRLLSEPLEGKPSA